MSAAEGIEPNAIQLRTRRLTAEPNASATFASYRINPSLLLSCINFKLIFLAFEKLLCSFWELSKNDSNENDAPLYRMIECKGFELHTRCTRLSPIKHNLNYPYILFFQLIFLT